VIDHFKETLKKMDTATFKKWKSSLKSSLSRKDQNMGQEADRFWAQIANDGQCFHKKDLALQYLETLQTGEEVLELFEELRAANRKVSIKLFGKDADMTAPPALHANKTTTTAPILVRVNGDGTAQKHLVEESDTEFWPTEAICRIHA